MSKTYTMPQNDKHAHRLGVGAKHAADTFDLIPISTLGRDSKLKSLYTMEGRSEVTAELRKLGAPMGTEPRRLIQYLATALSGCVLDAADGVSDIIPPDYRQRFDAASRSLLPVMKKLADLGRMVDPMLLGVEGMPTDEHPWLGSVDHVAAAAELFVGAAAGSAGYDAAMHLAEAARLIANVPRPVKASSKPGPPAAASEAFRIVRAVCLYRYDQGQPFDCKWGSYRHAGAVRGSRRTDDEVTPVSDTAQLIAGVRTALCLPVLNASLEKAHKTFLSQLDEEQRAPMLGDLLQIEF